VYLPATREPARRSGIKDEHVAGEALPIGQPAKKAWDELSLADVIAQTVRAVPGVCRMSKGRFALAATYGPGRLVPGVALWREAPGKLLIEVHIVVCESLLLAALEPRPAKAALTQPPVLLQLAEQIRIAVQQIFMGLHIVPHAIDVVIEDTG
jgi:hypothetical protein